VDNRQKKNDGGGYSFETTDMTAIHRFLVTGASSNFYKSGGDIARDSADILIKVIETSDEAHKKLVDLIVDISTQGRAAKQDAGIFALAVASSYGTVEGKQYALAQLNSVARTGTTLFQFVSYVTQFRGWGRALKRAIASWYQKPVDKLAYQVVKYKSREGYTHRDLFRLAHPEDIDEEVGNFILHGAYDPYNSPDVIVGSEVVKTSTDVNEIIGAIKHYNLTWEMIPTQFLNDVNVWKTLLDSGNVPLGALIRQLSRLTKIGILKPLGEYNKKIVGMLTDAEYIKKSRIHPLNVLIALKAYEAGRSPRNYSDSWTPVRAVVEALNKAFYLAFGNVEAANKRTLVAVDVSGSMTSRWGDTSSGLTANEIAAALSLVILNTEPEAHVIGFSRQVRELDIDRTDSLSSAQKKAQDHNFGSTNPASAIQWAEANGVEFDTLVVITDNEVNSGTAHTHQALETYRRKTGINAKMAVLATSVSSFSIADPSDVNSMDLAGFDSATPQILTEFSRGF
jgi:60 kDa SS-A/Ro ribonucleoprotein